MAPESFDAHGRFARVWSQPEDAAQTRRALMALVACPTGSIGTERKHESVVAEFPDRIGASRSGEVFHCGFHSKKSFGAASYLIVRPQGNVLIDSPRFSSPLARRIEAMGGAKWMLLTHSDDVADHAKWRARLGCERVIHADDRRIEVEREIEGEQAQALDASLLLIPTPGHTKGSMCILFEEHFLFSGDHLAFSPSRGELTAFYRACWYDWPTQIESMTRLAKHTFSAVLPGHGHPRTMTPQEMRAGMERLIAWMKSR